MRNFFKIFKIRCEELASSLAWLLFFVIMNMLCFMKYSDKFTATNRGSWNVFTDNFTISGFDPITYSVLTDWRPVYNVYRHPLLAFLVYPFSQLNHWLMETTNYNFCQWIVMIFLLAAVYYSYIFCFRIFRRVLGLGLYDSTLLASMIFSFGYIMVTFIVPDHFAISMFILVLALYLSGLLIQKGRELKIWQVWIIFFITAGVTLSNGIKIYIDTLFVNGKRMFRPVFFIVAVIIPSLIIWRFARMEFYTYVAPAKIEQKKQMKVKAQKKDAKLWANFCDTTQLKDSAAIHKEFKKLKRRLMIEEYRRNHRMPHNMHTGKPIAKGEFTQWTDITTPRWDTFVENLFGESLQLHSDHLLEDTLRSRPVIVEYRSVVNYIVEAIIVALFAAGIWFGRRSRFFWMCFLGFLFDMTLHMVLGFGINEVYIMTAHWAFVVPIAIGYVFCNMKGRGLTAIRTLVTAVTLFLFVYNARLLAVYLV